MNMGLDMYIYVRYHVHTLSGNDYEHNIDKELVGKLNTPFEVDYVLCEAVYWRKAWGIHNWLVKRVQEGKDDCATYYLSIETLEELLKECREVIDDPELLDELFPEACDMHEITYTEQKISGLLKWYCDIYGKRKTMNAVGIPPKGVGIDLEYHSSW